MKNSTVFGVLISLAMVSSSLPSAQSAERVIESRLMRCNSDDSENLKEIILDQMEEYNCRFRIIDQAVGTVNLATTGHCAVRASAVFAIGVSNNHGMAPPILLDMRTTNERGVYKGTNGLIGGNVTCVLYQL